MRTTYGNFIITSTFKGDKLWSADDKMHNYNRHIITVTNTETKNVHVLIFGAVLHSLKFKQTMSYCLLFTVFYLMQRAVATDSRIFAVILDMMKTV